MGTVIDMEVSSQNAKIGQICVKIPEEIQNQEETELSDACNLNATVKNKKMKLKFKYYIIILNKKVLNHNWRKIFLEKNSKKIFRQTNE